MDCDDRELTFEPLSVARARRSTSASLAVSLIDLDLLNRCQILGYLTSGSFQSVNEQRSSG